MVFLHLIVTVAQYKIRIYYFTANLLEMANPMSNFFESFQALLNAKSVVRITFKASLEPAFIFVTFL